MAVEVSRWTAVLGRMKHPTSVGWRGRERERVEELWGTCIVEPSGKQSVAFSNLFPFGSDIKGGKKSVERRKGENLSDRGAFGGIHADHTQDEIHKRGAEVCAAEGVMLSH